GGLACLHVDSPTLLVPCHKSQGRVCKRQGADAPRHDRKPKDRRLYSSQYCDTPAIFCHAFAIWIRCLIYRRGHSIRRAYASIPLQVEQEPYTGICMEGLQGDSAISYSDICSLGA